MNGMVVYQSKFGNSRRIAEAIAKGLSATGHHVEVTPVASAGNPETGCDFLIVGGPTRMARAYGPIKRFAKRAPASGCGGKPFATFSTGSTVYAGKPSAQAAEKLHELLEENGLVPIAPPFKAGVDDMHGPLKEGELERAEEFGMELGSKLSARDQ